MILGQQFWRELEEAQDAGVRACHSWQVDSTSQTAWHRRYHQWYDNPTLETDRANYCFYVGNWYLTLTLHLTCGPWASMQGDVSVSGDAFEGLLAFLSLSETRSSEVGEERSSTFKLLWGLHLAIYDAMEELKTRDPSAWLASSSKMSIDEFRVLMWSHGLA
ncbi:unnamed protein product [Symbiodinium sp. CCMP2592]|nr:unnamed protein product [Symbiodinium sp. CCMP2592]